MALPFLSEEIPDRKNQIRCRQQTVLLVPERRTFLPTMPATKEVHKGNMHQFTQHHAAWLRENFPQDTRE
jgi:hypothetical protein